MELTQEIIPMIKIEWMVVDGDWTYQDTVEMTEEEYAKETPETIRAKQDKEYREWKDYVTKPQPQKKVR